MPTLPTSSILILSIGSVSLVADLVSKTSPPAVSAAALVTTPAIRAIGAVELPPKLIGLQQSTVPALVILIPQF